MKNDSPLIIIKNKGKEKKTYLIYNGLKSSGFTIFYIYCQAIESNDYLVFSAIYSLKFKAQSYSF